jgi:hypothetical protein
MFSSLNYRKIHRIPASLGFYHKHVNFVTQEGSIKEVEQELEPHGVASFIVEPKSKPGL